MSRLSKVWSIKIVLGMPKINDTNQWTTSAQNYK